MEKWIKIEIMCIIESRKIQIFIVRSSAGEVHSFRVLFRFVSYFRFVPFFGSFIRRCDGSNRIFHQKVS